MPKPRRSSLPQGLDVGTRTVKQCKRKGGEGVKSIVARALNECGKIIWRRGAELNCNELMRPAQRLTVAVLYLQAIPSFTGLRK